MLFWRELEQKSWATPRRLSFNVNVEENGGKLEYVCSRERYFCDFRVFDALQREPICVGFRECRWSRDCCFEGLTTIYDSAKRHRNYFNSF